MAPKSFRPGLTPLEDRTVPAVSPEQVFAASATADLGQQQIQSLLDKGIGLVNVVTRDFLKDYLPTLTDQSIKAGKVLSEYQNDLQVLVTTDPSVRPLLNRVAEQRYKVEVNALYAFALTSEVGGIPLNGVTAPIPADQPIPPTPPPAPPAPPTPPPPDVTTNAGTTGKLPDITAPDFRDLGTGVKVQDAIVGQGAPVTDGQDVNVFYTGFLKDGTVFDGNRDKAATKFNTNGVIQGFKQGLIGMQPGGVRNISIPSALGYGPAGSPPSIPPNSDLVFEVKLLSSSTPTTTGSGGTSGSTGTGTTGTGTGSTGTGSGSTTTGGGTSGTGTNSGSTGTTGTGTGGAGTGGTGTTGTTGTTSTTGPTGGVTPGSGGTPTGTTGTGNTPGTTTPAN